MDAQMVDQEPQRSVQLIRRVDTRIPTPLLSVVVGGSSAGGPALGKLSTELKTGVRPAAKAPSTAWAPTASATSGVGRGWTSVVTKGPAPVASAWVAAPGRSAAVPTRVAPAVPAPTQPAPTQPVVNGEDVPDNWEDDM